ncbi:MAG: hypothetical protein KME13_25015 [Myxacorys californica WJT36-NPBG1]|jgi:hypothetical protein|nr:hypothetical protein [Myxacorys californica WJT36-NPBG1]
MVNIISMRKRPKDRLPHLPSIVDAESNTFTRREIAEMFGGINPSIISRDCSSIGLPECEPIDKEGVWRLYVLACYKRLRPSASRKSFVKLCIQHGDEVALEFVKLAGGSREDCNQLIENFLAKKLTKPLIV